MLYEVITYGLQGVFYAAQGEIHRHAHRLEQGPEMDHQPVDAGLYPCIQGDPGLLERMGPIKSSYNFV